MLRFRSLLVAGFSLASSTKLFGLEKDTKEVRPQAQVEVDEGKFERVGGTFVVSTIKHLKAGGFQVIFHAKEGKPRFERLVLDCSHVHVAVTEGAVLRLSADVVAQKNKTAEISQVVLFVPGTTGETPIWMLSRRSQSPKPPAKLIEMHAPSTDYQVF